MKITNNPLMKNIAGLRAGQLIVLYPTSKRDKKGSVYWHCRCDCGNNKDVTEDALTSGNTKSCGCLKEKVKKNIRNQLHFVDGTCVEWLEKRKYRCDNTSGFRGVTDLKNGKYSVNIGFRRERYYLGRYESFEEAVKVRLTAEKKLHDAFVEGYRQWEEKARQNPEWAKDNPYTFPTVKKIKY